MLYPRATEGLGGPKHCGASESKTGNGKDVQLEKSGCYYAAVINQLRNSSYTARQIPRDSQR